VSWEKRLEARLKGLRDLPAPRSLSSRVLATAALYAKPWHARPWYSWNAPAQAAFALSVALGALLVAQAARVPFMELSGELGRLAARWDWAMALGSGLGRALWSLRAQLALAVVLFATAAALPVAAIAALSRPRLR
jgi:hypothetical protein